MGDQPVSDQLREEAIDPPFTDNLPEEQTTGPSGKIHPLTEGPVAVSYPVEIPKASNPGKKPGWGWGL